MYKAVYTTVPREYSIEEIKAAEPEFFSRQNNRFFGTKNRYKYGNFIVLHNVKRTGEYFFGTGGFDYYAIYEFIHPHDRPEGLLLHRGSTRELSDAKQMIKTRDFRSKRERLVLPGV